MWFPYSLPAQWKAESERSHIDGALADNNERQFLVGFYLHSRATGEWEVEVHLQEPRWVTASEGSQGLSVGYYPNETGQLSEIICRVEDSNAEAALRRSYAHVTRVLSCWSAVKGRAFAILGFRIADLNHDARWRVLPHRPSAESFELPPCDALPEPYWAVLALYREARNSSSDSHRLLCCCKILRLWARRANPFDALPKRTAKLRAEPTDASVDREMLVVSGLMSARPDLEGIGFGKLPESIAPWHDRALAALTGEGPPPTADDYQASGELASVANLLDIASHRILLAEIDQWQSITEAERPSQDQ